MSSYFWRMPEESQIEKNELRVQFTEIIQTGDKLRLRSFLDDQNISDVADLVYEFPDQEVEIIANMSIHRAAIVISDNCHPRRPAPCA